MNPVLIGFGQFLIDHLVALGTTLGLGGGVGIIKFLRHCPPPKKESRWWGAIFDTAQDLVSNMSRIGERLLADGTIERTAAAPQKEDIPK